MLVRVLKKRVIFIHQFVCWLVRNIYGKEGLLQKRREAKLQRDTRKFEKLRIRFEKTGEINVDAEKGTENSKGLTTASSEGPATGLNQGAGGKPFIPFAYSP